MILTLQKVLRKSAFRAHLLSTISTKWGGGPAHVCGRKNRGLGGSWYRFVVGLVELLLPVLFLPPIGGWWWWCWGYCCYRLFCYCCCVLSLPLLLLLPLLLECRSLEDMCLGGLACFGAGWWWWWWCYCCYRFFCYCWNVDRLKRYNSEAARISVPMACLAVRFVDGPF